MVYSGDMKLEKFAICYNPQIQNSITIKDILLSILADRKVAADVFDIDNLCTLFPSKLEGARNAHECECKSGYDFVFVIGGDGTILKTARFYAKYQTPIFGINLGRLGFLSQSSKEQIKLAVEKILNGRFFVEDRIMLESGENIALNDFVIKGTSTGRTSRFSLQINGKFVCDYLADGIIVSTPTGSTAYGLSAGGPVLAPCLNAIVIVPICPHTLTARPLVIPDTEIITVSSGEVGVNYVVSTDGQNFYEFNSKIEIKKSRFVAKLALLDDSDFYSILRDKLHWGISPAIIK